MVKQGIPWMMVNDCKVALGLCQRRLMTVTVNDGEQTRLDFKDKSS